MEKQKPERRPRDAIPADADLHAPLAAQRSVASRYIDTFQSDPVVVFCAYGFPVGCKTATALRDAGFDATYMKGGPSAWKAIGGPIQSQTPQPIAILAEQVEP